jgi:hypothetical protein
MTSRNDTGCGRKEEATSFPPSFRILQAAVIRTGFPLPAAGSAWRIPRAACVADAWKHAVERWRPADGIRAAAPLRVVCGVSCVLNAYSLPIHF